MKTALPLTPFRAIAGAGEKAGRGKWRGGLEVETTR